VLPLQLAGVGVAGEDALLLRLALAALAGQVDLPVLDDGGADRALVDGEDEVAVPRPRVWCNRL